MNVPAVQVNAQVNAMTVDVEDYFQVQAFANVIDRSTWDAIPCRVEANMDHILQAFDRAGVKGTFFTLGWIADRHPGVVRAIVAAGHELASHGYGHARADGQTPEVFRDDVRRAKATLEDLGGVPVQGYRAPTFSIGRRNPWAFDVLAEEGYRYSSSVFPVRHDLYGAPDAPRFPYRPAAGPLLETPYTLFRLALRRFNRAEQAAGVFYFHPWEIDPAQPRVAAPRMSRFRHYVNIAAMPGRLERLLRDFAWDRMDRVFAPALAAA